MPTGRLNGFLGELQAAAPHPVRGGKQPRILFATQVQVAPPRIVIFTTGFLDAGYRRFIERRLREEFGFVGTPFLFLIRSIFYLYYLYFGLLFDQQILRDTYKADLPFHHSHRSRHLSDITRLQK